jgi:site-specific recombinase XerD
LDFLFYTGVRLEELANIKHSDYQGQMLRIQGKGNKVRYVFLPDFLIKHVRSNSIDYLFTNQAGQQLAKRSIQVIINLKVKIAGINKAITAHSFRRSFATNLDRNGVRLTTIQKLLGHSNIETTVQYIHNDYETLYQDYSKL